MWYVVVQEEGVHVEGLETRLVAVQLIPLGSYSELDKQEHLDGLRGWGERGGGRGEGESGGGGEGERERN